MRRSGTAMVVLLEPALLHIHIHIHHRIHGPPFDYVGLAVAAAASWIGLPGPGEPVLLAAAVLAAKGELDLATVIGIAFLAATAGGIIGWAIGLIAGRAVLTAPGPLRSLRIAAVERGEVIFQRYPVIAIVMTPAFVAGINRVPSRIYQPVNVVSAAVWSVGIGVGGYFVGPPVLDAVSDLGTGFTIAVVSVVVGLVALEVARRYRRARR